MYGHCWTIALPSFESQVDLIDLALLRLTTLTELPPTDVMAHICWGAPRQSDRRTWAASSLRALSISGHLPEAFTQSLKRPAPASLMTNFWPAAPLYAFWRRMPPCTAYGRRCDVEMMALAIVDDAQLSCAVPPPPSCPYSNLMSYH